MVAVTELLSRADDIKARIIDLERSTAELASQHTTWLREQDAVVRRSIEQNKQNAVKLIKQITHDLEGLQASVGTKKTLAGLWKKTPLDVDTFDPTLGLCTAEERIRSNLFRCLDARLQRAALAFTEQSKTQSAEVSRAAGLTLRALSGADVADAEAAQFFLELSDGCGDENGGSGEAQLALVQAAVLEGSYVLCNQLAEARTRLADARQLEGALLELHQLFVDMAALTMAQGELVDSIEHHVTRAADSANEGNRYLESAIRSQCWLRRFKRRVYFFVVAAATVSIGAPLLCS
jgi:t-SNARE complex subunit (syntaxin)